MVAANNRQTKRALLYDGHNRKAGVSARNAAARAQRLRRQWHVWLRERLKGSDETASVD